MVNGDDVTWAEPIDAGTPLLATRNNDGDDAY